MLTGTVNPSGQSTTDYFQYGTTTEYGSRTSPVSAGSETKNVNVSSAISSLSPNATYHYRLVAQNASGTTFGADKTFKTANAAAPPAAHGAPVARTGGAKSVTASSATLTGAVNPSGQSTTDYFQYGTTTGYGSQTSPVSAGAGTINVNVSGAIASLSPNATYHYRLVAQNASGTTFGADKTFKTARPSPISLVALPSALTFGQTTTLSGTVGGPGAAHATVTLERAGAIGGPYTALSTITADAKGKYSIAGLAPPSNVFYKAVANGSSSAPILVLVRFRIALLVSNTNPRRGHLVRFYGRVAPRHNGLHVRIQRFGSDGRWHLVKPVRLRSAFGNASKFSIRIAVNRGGLYRAVVGPDATHASGFSRSLRLHVH